MFMPKCAMYALNFLIYWVYTFALYMALCFVFGFLQGFAGSDFNFSIYGVSGGIAILAVLIGTIAKRELFYLKK